MSITPVRESGVSMRPTMAKTIRWIRQLLIAAVVAILFWSILAVIFEERFIFFPDSYPAGRYDEAGRVASLTDCWIPTEDHLIIHGWLARNDSAFATLLMFHGNAGNLSHRIDMVRAFHQCGFNVLIVDYRGYGRSNGSPTERGVYLDGLATFDYARHLPGVRPEAIILWGTSLGGAVAAEVALKRPAAGLILESTFTSAQEMAAIHYPFLPSRYFLRTALNTIDKIKNIHMPLLMIHGTHDDIVPLRLGKKLFAAANEPKEFYEIPGADHNDTFWIGGMEYRSRVTEFARRIIPEKSAATMPSGSQGTQRQ